MECNICYNEIGINTNTSCKAKPTHKICTECKRKNEDMCINRGHIPQTECIICKPLSIPIVIDIGNEVEVIEREEDEICCDRIIGDCGFIYMCIGFIGLLITVSGQTLKE